MSSKLELYDKLLCVACLCVGQELNKITEPDLYKFYTDTLKEIDVTIPDLSPSMCWECADVLRKAVAFKMLLKDSYNTLLTYPDEELLKGKCKSLLNLPDNDNLLEQLADTNVSQTEINPIEMDDFKVEEKPDSQMQLVYIKEENKGEWQPNVEVKKTDHPLFEDLKSDDGFSGSDHGSPLPLSYGTETMLSDVKERKKKRRTKEAKKRKKEDKNQKIINVDLTFEEMLAERETDRTRESYLSALYKCESCILGFNYKHSYKTHVQVKHAPTLGEYSCPVCDTIVASVESFTGHYKRHMKRYECSICHKRTADLKMMQQHFYTSHEIALKQYKCDVCGKISNSVDTHRYHKNTHKARVKCPQCDKTFSHRAGLMNHRLTVHENRNKFICPVCGKLFRWKASLKRHQDSNHRGDQQAAAAEAYCLECDITFASISSFQRHMKNSLKHVSQLDLRFMCDHCKRRFADKTKLRDHIEEKHLHRTYQCHICNKPSKNRVGLDQHIRNVHRGRPNNKMCHHCGKGFPTKVQLESHIRTHTGERPFICEYCPTTFSQQSNLYKHNKQVHLNIKSKRSPGKKAKEDVSTTELPTIEITVPYHAPADPLDDQTPVAVIHLTPEGGFVMQ